MKHIIDNRYASIFAQPLPGYRVGDASPVTFINREKRYHGWYIHDGRGMTHCERPQSYVAVSVPAGSYGSHFPAVIS